MIYVGLVVQVKYVLCVVPSVHLVLEVTVGFCRWGAGGPVPGDLDIFSVMDDREKEVEVKLGGGCWVLEAGWWRLGVGSGIWVLEAWWWELGGGGGNWGMGESR